MGEVVNAANTKVNTLWECVGQWTQEIRHIRSPQDVYKENYQSIRGRFEHELQQLRQHTVHPETYQRGSDALVQLGGEIKELEIQYAQSVTAMEQDYQERLDAAHRSLAYRLFDAFGDTLSDPCIQDRLRLALISQESTAETNTAGGEPNTAPDPHTVSEANPGPDGQMIAETHVSADANPSPGLNPAPEDPTTEGETPQENPSSGEAEVSQPHENLNPEEHPALEVLAPETNPAPPMDSATGANPTSEAHPLLETSLPLETNPTSQATPSLETNVAPGTSAAPEANFDPHTNQYSQTNRATDTNPASATNPVPETNLTPVSNLVSGTTIVGDETIQQAKEAHQPNLAAASQVSDREGQVANPLSQHQGKQNDESPAGSSSNHQLQSEPPAVRSPRKRLPATTIDQQQQQKRPRHADVPIASTNESVDFDQVFQNGNAQIKYLIAQYPPTTGEWYILECKTHRKHFPTKNPIHGAAKHLNGKAHRLTKEHSLAVRQLGTRVLNCNAALAEKNNNIARDAFSKGLGLPPKSRVSRKRTQPHPGNGTESNRQLQGHGKQTRPQENPGTSIPECILSPVVGEIYATRYRRFLYPVLVLPWASFDHFKWKASLLRLTPPCYLFDKKLDQYPRGWAQGYEDGGPLVSQRHYPVIYFDGRRFPEQSDVNWVPVSSFKAFDPNDTNIVHRKCVAEFLQNEDPRLRADPHDDLEEYITISDDSDSDDSDTGNGVKQEFEKGLARDMRTTDNNDENTILGERSKDSEGDTNRNSQDNDRQGQAEKSSHNEKRNGDNDPVFSYNSVWLEDIDLGTESLSDAQIQSLLNVGLHPLPRPSLPSAPEQRLEAPFVTGASSEIVQAGPQQHTSSGDSSSKQPTTGVEGEQAGTLGNAGQSSQPAPQGSISQPLHSSIPPRLPKDQAAVAAQAAISMAPEVFGNEQRTHFPQEGTGGAHVDAHDTRTATAVDPQQVKLHLRHGVNSDLHRSSHQAPKPYPQQRGGDFFDPVLNAHVGPSRGPVSTQQNASG